MVATAATRVETHRVPYGGLVTRAVGLGIDAAIANGIVIVAAALLGLIGSLVGELRPAWLVAVVACVGWALVVGGYFALFWATAGQTPGMRLMRLRVMGPDGEHPHLGRSIVRVVGLALAIIPLFAGFLPVLVDERRRGLHDMLARTVVVYEP